MIKQKVTSEKHCHETNPKGILMEESIEIIDKALSIDLDIVREQFEANQKKWLVRA